VAVAGIRTASDGCEKRALAMSWVRCGLSLIDPVQLLP
jgi:hypothetical protein